MPKKTILPLTKADALALRRLETGRRVPKKTIARLVERGLMRWEGGLLYTNLSAIKALREQEGSSWRRRGKSPY
jgi:hypothetical protein